MISAVIACTVYITVLLVMPGKLELALNWVQLGCLLSALCCIMDCTLKFKRNLFCQLQVGAITCFILGQLFWTLHLLVLGYDNENFSISDLSWMGFYLFLYSAVFGIIDSTADDRSRNMRKYRIAALIAPALLIASGAMQILTVKGDGIGGIFYVIVYTAVMSALSYYSLKLLIIPSGGNPCIKAARLYNIVILALLVTDTVWTFSEFLEQNLLLYISELILSLLFLLIVPAAYKVVRIWETC